MGMMKILFKPYSGRVADPENLENVADATENRFKVSFPWICQHNQCKIPENDARQECHQVHPVTGNGIKHCLFICLTVSMKVMRHWKLTW